MPPDVEVRFETRVARPFSRGSVARSGPLTSAEMDTRAFVLRSAPGLPLLKLSADCATGTGRFGDAPPPPLPPFALALDGGRSFLESRPMEKRELKLSPSSPPSPLALEVRRPWRTGSGADCATLRAPRRRKYSYAALDRTRDVEMDVRMMRERSSSRD